MTGPRRCRSSHRTGRHERLTLRHWTQSSPGANLRPMSLTVRDLIAAARRRIREIQPAELIELQKFRAAWQPHAPEMNTLH